ncbi:DUF167 domain-containing protein [Ruegeria litorea]|uniref:DUF167 domain-containing protein n=1 Tax=Falsiruegeria litorea TaxID=1280831 RepID=A0ABS5WKI5_9RHOB|nr:DUF167 domain-containing protein [Falsiruegeria litorea]MBT3139571.1 DUF167 domain-containing protein [Falsiruegeria litorea]
MAKPKLKNLPDLSHLVVPGQEISLRVTPKAARTSLIATAEGLRMTVTAVPENGKANAAVRQVLAAAMGVAQTRLNLIRGQTARDKTFVYEEG